MIRRTTAMALVAWLLLPCPGVAQQASWLRAELGAVADNQPRTAQRADLEAGRYLAPALTAAALLRVERAVGDATARGVAPGIRLTAALPGLRLGVEGSAGMLAGHGLGDAAALYGLSARLGLGSAVTVRASTSRDRYTATLASLDTLLMRQSHEAALDRSGAPRWAFAVVGRQERFGDGNPVSTGYAWLLAPVAASATGRARVGYSFAVQDAVESRWEPDPAPARRRGNRFAGADTIGGRYAPYYTPHDVVVHSLLLEGVAALGRAWLTVNVSAGVHATETAPTLQRLAPVPAAPELLFFERSFRPAQVVASLAFPAGTSSMRLQAEHERTAYYRATGARLTVTRAIGGP